MKLIPLTRGQFAKVDDADYEWLNQWKWCVKSSRGYAFRGQWDGIKVVSVSMARLILGFDTGDPRQVDHINQDKLDNQRHNLRTATASENSINRRLLRSDNTSGFRGVFLRDNGRWQAYVDRNRRRKNLGMFDSRELAAAARDNAAKELHGEFAVLNEVNLNGINRNS